MGGEDAELVEHAGDNDQFSGEYAKHRFFCHVFGAHCLDTEPHAGTVVELGVHRAGAEQADGHTAMLVAQLLSDGERKTHHIVFGGVVAGEQRTGEKSGAGCHVEDSAAATLLEVPEKQLG